MNVEVSEELANRVNEAAARESLSVSEYVERALLALLSQGSDDPLSWVRGTASRLNRVWGDDDFSDWSPPYDA
jgi:hypothetical protein